MALTKKPVPVTAKDPADAFIEAAPDGRAASQAPAGEKKGGRVYKARKIPVHFTAESDLLAAFDAKAEELCISRAAALALAMRRFIAAGA